LLFTYWEYMKRWHALIVLISLLLGSCATNEKNHYKGLHKVWFNKELDINATSLIVSEGYIYGTTLDKRLFKLDLGTGKAVWNVPSSTSYMGQKPLLCNEQLFIGGSDVLNAFDLNGSLLWSMKTEGNAKHSIVDYEDLVLSSISGKGLVAYNKSNGQIEWQHLPDHQMLSLSPPSIQDSLIAVGNFGSSVENGFRGTIMVNAKTGEEVWQWKKPRYLASEALFHQNVLYSCFDSAYTKGQVIAFNIADGSVLWETASSPETGIKPALCKDGLLIASYKTGLNCLDLPTGTQKWTLNDEALAPATELVVHDGLVYFGTQKRELLVVNEQGLIQFRTQFNYGVGTLVVYKDRIYVIDGGGALYQVPSMDEK